MMKFLVRALNNGLSEKFPSNFPIPLKNSSFHLPDGLDSVQVAEASRRIIVEMYKGKDISDIEFAVQLINGRNKFSDIVYVGQVYEDWQ